MGPPDGQEGELLQLLQPSASGEWIFRPSGEDRELLLLLLLASGDWVVCPPNDGEDRELLASGEWVVCPTEGGEDRELPLLAERWCLLLLPVVMGEDRGLLQVEALRADWSSECWLMSVLLVPLLLAAPSASASLSATSAAKQWMEAVPLGVRLPGLRP